MSAIVHVYVCRNGCHYAPGYVGRKPLGKQVCHRCHTPLFHHKLALPEPPEVWADRNLWEGSK